MKKKLTMEELMEQFLESLPPEEGERLRGIDINEFSIQFLQFYLSKFPGNDTLEFFLSGSNLDGCIPKNGKAFNPSGTSRSSFLYLQSMATMTCPATHSTTRENFNSYLLLEVMEGTGYAEYEKCKFTIDTGDLLLLDCRKHHHFRAESENGWTNRIIHFDGISMAGIYPRFLHSKCFVFPKEKNKKARELISDLIAINLKESADNEILSNCLLVQIITELLLQCPTQEKNIPEWIREIQEYLKKNCHNNNSLDLLEAQFNRSKYYICHEFKRYTGKTIQQYLTIQRMNRAEELLQYTPLSHAEIAMFVGFENASSFSKAFSKQYGMTPGMYRKQFQMISK